MLSYIPHKKNSHSWRTVLFITFVVCISAGLAFSVQAYPQNWRTEATLSKISVVDPKEAITVDFSFPVIPTTIENSFILFPQQKVSFKWEDKNRRVVITPSDFWKPGSRYDISIKNGKNIFFREFNQQLSFAVQGYPALKNIVPANGAKNVAVDIEEPVSVSFDRPLDDYNVKFVVDPNETLGYQMSDDKMQINLLAKNDFKWSTHYSIAIYIKYKRQSTDGYVKIGETSFDTVAEPLPATWSKDLTIRTQQAKQFTNPQIMSGKYIDVNLSQQVMVIFENGQPVDSYIVSSGKASMPTPTGTFKIENKAARAWSKEFGLWMPNWMAILASGKVGIHELPEWPSGYKEGAAHLGTPVSHGCIRLGVGAAKRVFDWADIGTPVVVHQ